ncbi:hypothetical protein V7128_03780 [Neobacillus vireti]
MYQFFAVAGLSLLLLAGCSLNVADAGKKAAMDGEKLYENKC